MPVSILAISHLAQEAQNALDPFRDYLDLGFIALFAVLFFSRKVRSEGEVKEKDAEITELKAELREYIEHYQKEVLPALIDLTKVSGEIVAYLNKRRN